MDAYCELRLRPDPEFPATLLMNALFAKLHRALSAGNETRVGISFPDVEEIKGTLGPRLRLHGNAEDLVRLNAGNWLQGMRDHLCVGEILPVPDNASHRRVCRVQAKSNPERLRRRAIRRLNLSPEAAAERIPDHAAERLNLPYLTVHSQSTDQQFRLFIQHEALRSEAVPGKFNAYGLSQTATVPWF